MEAGANAPHQGDAHDQDGSFEYVLSKASERLETSQSDSVKLLTKQADEASGTAKANAFKNLANYWMKTGSVITAGYYNALAADANPSDREQRRLAARMLAMGINGAADSTARNFASHQAVHQYEALLESDPNDTKAKLELGMVYVETNDVMKGVLMLCDVEKTDPDNEAMNLTLGRLAVVSGQFDKAITRLERLIKQHPDNAEAYLHLAEAYRAVGQKEKAVETLEQCKRVVKDSPEAVQQVEQIITSIKKS